MEKGEIVNCLFPPAIRNSQEGSLENYPALLHFVAPLRVTENFLFASFIITVGKLPRWQRHPINERVLRDCGSSPLPTVQFAFAILNYSKSVFPSRAPICPP